MLVARLTQENINLLQKISTSSFNVLDHSNHKKWFQCLSLSISKQQPLREDKKGAEGLGKVVKCKLYCFGQDKVVMESAISHGNWGKNILNESAIFASFRFTKKFNFSLISLAASKKKVKIKKKN